jgi:hypothetical protein
MGFAAVALLILRRIDIPLPSAAERSGPGRPLLEIVRQPVFVAACLSAVTAYAVMNLLMGATPLAMQICGLPYDSAALVIQWHIVGMFAPALFVGALVHRFGAVRIMAAGVTTYAICLAAALTGQRSPRCSACTRRCSRAASTSASVARRAATWSPPGR